MKVVNDTCHTENCQLIYIIKDIYLPLMKPKKASLLSQPPLLFSIHDLHPKLFLLFSSNLHHEEMHSREKSHLHQSVRKVKWDIASKAGAVTSPDHHHHEP